MAGLGARLLYAALCAVGLLGGVVGCGGGGGGTVGAAGAGGVRNSGGSSASGAALAASTTGSGAGGDGSAPVVVDVAPLSAPAPVGSKYVLGFNFPWWNYGTDFGTGGWGKYTDWNGIESEFGVLHKDGMRVARWYVFCDGRYSPDFNPDGSVSGLDSQFFADIDHALKTAARNHIYLMLTLTEPVMFNAANLANGVQLFGHAALLTNAATQQSFLDKALKPLVRHIAASPYRTSVFAYDIMSEPEGAMAGLWGGANVSTPTMQTFIQRCATTIHSDGGGIAATVGSAQPMWVHLWQGLGLDFYEVHYYPGMDGSGEAGGGLPLCASLNLDKPCIVGEFPSVNVSYGLSDTTPRSARWYLDTIHDRGYAGALVWSVNLTDGASDWLSFEPVMKDWAQAHASEIGP